MSGLPLAAAKSLLFHVACLGDEARYFALKGCLMRAAARLGGYERAYVDCLPLFVGRGSVAVDVGANFGAYTHALAARVGPSGRVLSFEPLPPVADCLARACAHLRNVTIIAQALSDGTSDHLELRVPYIGWNVPEPALAHAGASHPSERVWKTFRVPARRLDDHADLVGPVRFVKADVEGHELEFLAGAERTVRASRPVLQVESAGIARDPDAAGAWLRSHEYTLFTLHGGRLRRADAEDVHSLNVYLVPSEGVPGLAAAIETSS